MQLEQTNPRVLVRDTLANYRSAEDLQAALHAAGIACQPAPDRPQSAFVITPDSLVLAGWDARTIRDTILFEWNASLGSFDISMSVADWVASGPELLAHFEYWLLRRFHGA